MLLEIFILYSTAIAFTSVTYTEILSHEPVLNWWFRFGLRFENSWFYPIIWGCPLCNSGQIALWFYVYNWIFNNEFNGNLFDLIVFVSITIGQAYFFNKAQNLTEKE